MVSTSEGSKVVSEACGLVCPKPLITVAGRPLIDHGLDKLRAAGSDVVIDGVDFKIMRETEILAKVEG